MSSVPREPDRGAERVLIVDDHPLVRFGLGQLISDEPGLVVCGEAESIAQALEVVDATNPDIVVVDISLKDGSGLDLIKEIRSRHESVITLVYSMHDELLFAERALRAGARGYVNKQAVSTSIVDAIKKALAGTIVVSDQVTKRMLSRASAGGLELGQDPMLYLSNRELEVFELVGQGLTTHQIAERFDRSVKTIETHRERIKKKLSLHSGNELNQRAMLWVVGGG